MRERPYSNAGTMVAGAILTLRGSQAAGPQECEQRIAEVVCIAARDDQGGGRVGAGEHVRVEAAARRS